MNPPLSPDELLAVQTLLRGTADRLRGVRDFATDTTLRQVLAALAAAARNRLEPILLLFQNGMVAEAAVLTRTLVESEISAAYMCSGSSEDQEKLARRFVGFDSVQRRSMIGRIRRHAAGAFDSVSQDRQARLRSSADAAIREFPDLEDKAGRGWSGLGFSLMLKRIEPDEVRQQLQFAYEVVYFSLSDFAHPTIAGIRYTFESGGDTLAKSAVPLYAALSATRIIGMAAKAGGVESPNILDLVQDFHRQMPTVSISASLSESG